MREKKKTEKSSRIQMKINKWKDVWRDRKEKDRHRIVEWKALTFPNFK